MAAVTLLTLSGNVALAAISKPDTPSQLKVAPDTSLVETREILDRASFIAFQGASAVQKLQAMSTDSATSELLRNYMAAMVYIPQGLALPTDEQALDEPWMASVSGTTDDDGMVLPNIGDDDEGPAKGIQIDTPTGKAAQFLRFLKPVQNALLTSPFGFRWGRPHQGIDLAAPVGTAIVAAEQGKVVYSGWKSGYGNFVAIDHGHGYQTHYAHCSKLVVRAGQKVSKGALIAKVGNTGHSTGPHLHFEVVANGVHRNPIKMINRQVAIVKAD